MFSREGKGRLIKHRSAEANATKTSNQSRKTEVKPFFTSFALLPLTCRSSPTCSMTADMGESDDDVFASNFNDAEFLIKGKVDVFREGGLGALSGECQVLMHQLRPRTIPECFLQR